MSRRMATRRSLADYLVHPLGKGAAAEPLTRFDCVLTEAIAKVVVARQRLRPACQLVNSSPKEPVNSIRDDLPLSARRINQRHGARRHRFDCRDPEVFLLARMLVGSGAITGRVPVDGSRTIEIAELLARRVEVKDDRKLARGFDQ